MLTASQLEELYQERKLSQRQIAKLCGVDHTTIGDWLCKYGIPSRSLSEAARNRRYCKLKPNLEITPNFAYLLGIIWGDGHVCGEAGKYEVGVSCGNDVMANECLELLREVGLHPRKYYVDQSKYGSNFHGYYKVVAYSKKLAEWLKSLSLEGLRGLFKKDILIGNFWRGMFLAEGYVWRGRQLHIANTNKELLDWGKVVLETLGYHPTLYSRSYPKHPTWKPLYRLCLQRKAEVCRFLEET